MRRDNTGAVVGGGREGSRGLSQGSSRFSTLTALPILRVNGRVDVE
jgi:hypothetical protein